MARISSKGVSTSTWLDTSTFTAPCSWNAGAKADIGHKDNEGSWRSLPQTTRERRARSFSTNCADLLRRPIYKGKFHTWEILIDEQKLAGQFFKFSHLHTQKKKSQKICFVFQRITETSNLNLKTFFYYKRLTRHFTKSCKTPIKNQSFTIFYSIFSP